MGKTLEILGDALFWIPGIYSGLGRSRDDDDVTAQWKSYKRRMLSSGFILLGYFCLTLLAWILGISDTPDTGNYSPIIAQVYDDIGLLWDGVGFFFSVWLLISVLLFSLHCRKHELPWA